MCVCVCVCVWVCCCSHRVKLGLGVVQMRSLHDLRELSIQTHTEVKHSSINLNLLWMENEMYCHSYTSVDQLEQNKSITNCYTYVCYIQYKHALRVKAQ